MKDKMTTRIERDFSFQAGVYFNGVYSMNIYNFTAYMNVETDSPKEQNVSMERIKFFLSECLENSIFIQDTEKKAIEKYKNADMKLAVLPEEPYDQIIAIALIIKLNAIVEGRLMITDITIHSKLSDDVKFLYDIDEPIGPFEERGWWNETSPAITCETVKQNKKDKIVKLVKTQSLDWADVDLEWDETRSYKERPEIIFTTDLEKHP